MSNSFFYGLIILCLTSCFEIVEEVNINQAGEGDFKVTVNLSKSKGQVKNLLALDTIHGKHIPSTQEIGLEMDKIASELEAMNGISSVHTRQDFDNFILSIGYHFKTIDHLNNSIKNIISNHTIHRPDLTNKEIYRYENGVFERLDEFKFDNLAKGLHKDVKILETSSYTTIYRFENTITNTTNKNSRVSKSGKAIMHRVKAAALVKNTSLIQNKIQLK